MKSVFCRDGLNKAKSHNKQQQETKPEHPFRLSVFELSACVARKFFAGLNGDVRSDCTNNDTMKRQNKEWGTIASQANNGV